MPRIAALKKILGIAPVIQGSKCIGVVTCADSGCTYGKCIPPGDYVTIAHHDLSVLLSNVDVCRKGWIVFLSGEHPILAVNRSLGISIRSMHRLGDIAEFREQPHNSPEERAEGALWFGERWLSAQADLGIRPGSGTTATVRQFAPMLAKERKHGGHTLLYRQQCYRGGRNEVYRYQADEPVIQYDLRSAYAGAYGQGIPGECIGRGTSLPSRDYFAAALTVSIPNRVNIPLAPYRTPGGMLTFPTGTFDLWCSAPEVRLLEGGGFIKKVKEVHVFREWHALDHLAQFFYEARRASHCPIKSSLCKLILVSAYGSLGLSDVMPLWHVHPESVPDGADIIKPGFYQTWEKKSGPTTAHLPAASWVTSKIRALLGSVLTEKGRDPYHCAVDSVVLSSSEHPLALGDAAGNWSVKGEHPAPSVWKTTGTYSLGGGAILRSSGVPRSKSAAYLDGEAVTLEKRVGARHTIKLGAEQFVSVTVRLKSDTGQKRPPVGDGRSRPLTIQEADKHLR